jgi:hypothetical protein
MNTDRLSGEILIKQCGHLIIKLYSQPHLMKISTDITTWVFYAYEYLSCCGRGSPMLGCFVIDFCLCSRYAHVE